MRGNAALLYVIQMFSGVLSQMYKFDWIFCVLTPVLGTDFELFRGGQYILVDDARMP